MDTPLSTETARLLFLSWLRTNYPQVYSAAIQKTLQDASPRGLNGLGRSPLMLYSLAGLGMAGMGDDASVVNDTGGSSYDFGNFATDFGSLLQNVSTAASTYLTAANSVNNVSTNISRVSGGQAPLNANGTIMTVAQMQAAGYPSATIQQIEANLARSPGGSTGTLLLFGGLGLLAVLLLKKA